MAEPPATIPTHAARPVPHPAPSSAAEHGVGNGGVGRWVPVALALTGRALANPAVAVDLLRVAWRFRARGWWRRFPFLPVPARAYVRWRMHTAYGDEDAIPPAADVVRYARWVGRQR